MKKLKVIFCAVFRHSLIQHYCFGYFNCARCGAQLGDSLGSVYPQAEKVVIVGHNCKKCRENYKKLSWVDKFLAPNPFKKRR